MGLISLPHTVKLFVGLLAREFSWLEEARGELSRAFGPIDLASEVIPFTWTGYYAAEMGVDLKRQFFSFERLIDPGEIASIKRRTNEIEEEFAKRIAGGPARPVNLDPGYLDLSKLVLATTKDFAHRIYLEGGIYAEVTLQYHCGRWEALPWTYPDYRSDAYSAFFVALRALFAAQRAW
jgi:hypothetical protein